MRRLIAIAAVLVTFTAAAPSSAEPISAPPPGFDLSRWSAVAVPSGHVEAAVAQLDAIAQRALAATGVPGMSISVVHQGKTIYAKGFGVRDVDTKVAVDADTSFQVASVSKTIGASVVAAVIGTTDIEWTDPVITYLPEFELSDPYVTRKVTIGDMYAMRSGLPHQAGDDIAELGYGRSEVLRRLRYLPLTPFRAKYAYANYSVTTGAEAVAQKVGVPWNDLSKRRLYTPLGMTSTTSSIDEFRALANRATLHVPVGGTWVANGIRDEDAQSPAGMVASSANDMAKWMIMELADGRYEGRQVVDATALQQTRVPRILTTPNADTQSRAAFYGYGTIIRTDATGRVRWSHSGAFSQGAATTFTLLPAENLGITVLTNGYPMGVPEAIVGEFLDLVELGISSTDWLDTQMKLVAAAVGGAPELPRPPASPSPSGTLTQYVGTYGNDFYGDLTLHKRGNALVGTIGPKKEPLRLVPYDGLTFGMPDGKGGVMPIAQFVKRDGNVVGLEIVVLRAPGQERLLRR